MNNQQKMNGFAWWRSLGVMLTVAVVAGCATQSGLVTEPSDVQANPWFASGNQALSQRIAQIRNQNRAKNVILFVGDGMGISTITATRIFDGQTRGETGEENVLPFETFPHVALVKTYNTNQQVSDSAGTATAIHSGVKTRAGVIGISHHAQRGNCEQSLANTVPSLVEQAESAGFATGIVTTTRLTHATPATTYAHSADRDWEDDSDLPEQAAKAGCKDIARQFVDFRYGDGVDVAFGGGRRNFLPKSKGGRRNEGDLITKWQRGGGLYVSNSEQLNSLSTDQKVLGLFSSSHMTYMADKEEGSDEPTLSEMTAKAVELLSSRQQGYYLLVEGGRIDHGHHDGIAGKALMEGQEFANAVRTAVSMVDLSDTLILVTADHSHVFTIAGYPTRGNPILGLVKGNTSAGEPSEQPTLAGDGKPYTTLGYWTGPGAIDGERPEPDTGVHAKQQAPVLTGYTVNGRFIPSETHGGEDVALFAAGPQSHLVSGVMEQNVIYHIIAHALGLSE